MLRMANTSPQVSTTQTDKFFHLFEGAKPLLPHFNERKMIAYPLAYCVCFMHSSNGAHDTIGLV